MAAQVVYRRVSLHKAAEGNDILFLENALLEGNFDSEVNLKDKDGNTVLHCLLNSNTFTDLEEVKRGIQILINGGADINIQNNNGETPLHSVINNYLESIPEIIRYLLTHGKDYQMTIQDNDGYSLFHMFMSDFSDHVKEKGNYREILQEKENFIQSLLRGEILSFNAPALLNQKENNGYSAFYTYIGNSSCSADTVQLMVDCGSDVNTSSKIGTTPLMESVLRRRSEIAEILLKAGANPNQTDIFGQTCIFRVFTNSCFELLKQYGANFCIKDKFGRSPITNIALYTPEDLPSSSIVISQNFSEHSPVFENFLAVGVDCNSVDVHGSSVLHYAAWYGEIAMIEALIQHGANLNVQDNNGFTPLDLALHVGNDHIYSLLGKPDSDISKPGYETKYCRLIINQEETDNMEFVLKDSVGINDDPAILLTSLVSSPRLGMTSLRPESRQITSEVTTLMQKIAAVVGRLNSLFSCTVYPTGSSTEGTKIGDPDEFDFVFCLDNFSKLCIPCQDAEILNTGFVRLETISNSCEVLQKLEAFLDGTILSAHLIRGAFQDLITAALNEPEVWTFEHLYFDGLLGYPTDKPILKLELHWFGSIVKHMFVGVDIVPAVLVSDWRPKESIDDIPVCPDGEQFLLIFHSPECSRWNDNDNEHLVRISSSLMEKQHLKSLPQICIESYAAAKILKSINFSPKVQFNEDNFEKFETPEFRILDESMSQKSDERHVKESIEARANEQVKADTEKDSDECLVSIVQSNVSEEQSGGLETNEQQREHNGVSPWIMEIDDSYNVRKIFTPKDQSIKKKKIYFDAQMGMNCKTSVFESEKHKLIYFKPYEIEPNSTEIDETNESEKKDIYEETENLNDKADLTCSEENGVIEETCRIDNKGEDGLSTDDNEENERDCVTVDEDNKKVCSYDNDDENDCSIVEDRDKKDCSIEDGEEGDEEDDGEEGDKEDDDEEGDEEDDIEWEGGDVVSASDEISSYMLKTCLFYVLQEDKSNTFTLQELTIKIYEKLHAFANEYRLPYYFLPYLDVFTFVNSHIRVIPDNELEVARKQSCERIRVLCNVILGILKQKKTLC